MLLNDFFDTKFSTFGLVINKTVEWLLSFLLVFIFFIPTLLPRHRYPQTVFYNEFYCALLGILIFVVSLLWMSKGVFRISLMNGIALCCGPAILGFYALTAGQGASLVMAWSIFAYIAFGVLAMISVQRGAEILGRQRLVTACASGAVLCALLQTVAAGLQLAGQDMEGLVMVKLLNSVYGNIAQPNHFGNLLWLGVASSLYLWLTRRVPAWLAVLVIADLCFFSALSASRAVLLYMVGIPLLAFVFWRKGEPAERSRVIYAVAIVFILGTMGQLLVMLPSVRDALGVASSIGRLDDAGSNTQRLFDWWTAWHTSLEYPLRGAGAGTFAWQTGLHSIGLEPAHFVRIGENAHNTVLQWLAEFGWVFTGVALLAGGGWLIRRFRTESTQEDFWALCLLLVVGAHSLVEYPLWYTYFIWPVAVAIAVIDAGDRRLPVVVLSRVWLVLPLLLWGAVLAWAYQDYKSLERGYRLINAEEPLSAERQAQVDQIASGVSPYSLFATHAGIMRLRAWRPAQTDDSAQMVDVCDSAVRVKPSYLVLTRCIEAYAQQARQADAQLMIDMVCGAYPPAMRHGLPAMVQAAYAPRHWAVLSRPGCVAQQEPALHESHEPHESTPRVSKTFKIR